MSKQQLIKNSAVGLAQFILTSILTLVSVPVFINKLGMELYGIFAIVSVIGNLNLLTNFGLNGALMVYLAKQGKCKESNYDIAATQVIMVSLIAVISSIVLLFRKYIIIHILAVPVAYLLEASQLLTLLIFANYLLLIGQTFTSIIDSQQKVYITNICQFGYSTIYFGGMIIVVSFGGKLAEVGILALSAASIWFVSVWVSAHRIWGKIDLLGFRSNFVSSAKKQLSYGAKLYTSGLLIFLFEPLSKILLSNFININSVAIYDIAVKIRSLISGITGKALYPLYPYIANSQKSEQFNNKIHDLTKKIILVVIPMILAVIFMTPIIIEVWLKNSDPTITIMSIGLSAIFLLTSPTILPIYQYMNAKNMAEKNIFTHGLADVVNIILFFSLYKLCGIYSILISNIVANIASFSVFQYYQYKYLNINLQQSKPFYVKMVMVTVICLLPCVIISIILRSSLWDIPIYTLLIGFFFVLSIRKLRIITKDDLDIYFGTFPPIYKYLSVLFIGK